MLQVLRNKVFIKCFLLIVSLVILFSIVNTYLNRSFSLEKDLRVIVENEGIEYELTPWLKDSICYFFLPSFFDKKEARLTCSMPSRIIIDGEKCIWEDLRWISLGKYYTMLFQEGFGNKSYKLCFLSSARIPTLFIRTKSGNDIIEKKQEETVFLNCIEPTGKLNFSDYSTKATIRGRGSSTWNEEKKPYLLELSGATSVLGMKPAHKWVLLANAFDQSNLRNKIIYDYGRLLNMGFVTDSRYADLYINGDYRGLYLIAEKVECAENRLHIDGCDSIYLFHQSSKGQAEKVKEKFITRYDQTILIDYPKKYEAQDYEFMKRSVQQMEDEIMSNQGGGQILITGRGHINIFLMRFLRIPTVIFLVVTFIIQ